MTLQYYYSKTHFFIISFLYNFKTLQCKYNLPGQRHWQWQWQWQQHQVALSEFEDNISSRLRRPIQVGNLVKRLMHEREASLVLSNMIEHPT